MPRRPTRHRHLLKPRPVTFSSFSRSVAQLASSYMAKRQMQDSKLHTKSSSKSAGNRVFKHTLEEKSKQSESSSEDEFEGVVQADFAFFDPKPNDFHGVKTLLQTYLDNKQWDLSGFVDLILGQTTVGTVVKVEGDEDDGVFSVVTALNLQRYKDHKCIVEFKEFLLKACQGEDVVDDLRSVLGEQAQNVGLLVSQRVVNLPPQLLPPLYDALFDEVSWATEDEPTEKLRNSFRFKFYILVGKIYKHKNSDPRKNLSNDSDEAIIYTKPEDEIFHRISLWSFSFPLHTQQPSTQESGHKCFQLFLIVVTQRQWTKMHIFFFFFGFNRILQSILVYLFHLFISLSLSLSLSLPFGFCSNRDFEGWDQKYVNDTLLYQHKRPLSIVYFLFLVDAAEVDSRVALWIYC